METSLDAPRDAVIRTGWTSICTATQFVCHFNPNLGEHGRITSHYKPVDGHGVPVPHCGVVLEMQDWSALAERLRAQQVEFVIEPYIRFQGQPGEQATMFFLDPRATRWSSNRLRI